MLSWSSFRRFCRSREPDGGQSWLAALATSWVLFFSFAYFRSYGVLYLFLTRIHGFSREEASMGFNIILTAVSCTSLLTGFLSLRIPLTVICYFTTFICGIGIMMPYFISDKIGFVIAGILYGAGLGPVENTCLVLISQRFVKHRTSAIGLAYAGLSFGGIIFPIIVYHLCIHYGIQGGCLILGAITLNGCIGVCLQRITNGKKDDDHVLPHNHMSPRLSIQNCSLGLEHCNGIQKEPIHSNHVYHSAENKEYEMVSLNDSKENLVALKLKQLEQNEDKAVDSGSTESSRGGFAYERLEANDSTANLLDTDQPFPTEDNDCDMQDDPNDYPTRFVNAPTSNGPIENDNDLGLGNDNRISMLTIYEDCYSQPNSPSTNTAGFYFPRRRLITEESGSYASALDAIERNSINTGDTYEMVISTTSTAPMDCALNSPRRSVSFPDIPEAEIIAAARTTHHSGIYSWLMSFVDPFVEVGKYGMFYVCTVSTFAMYYINGIYAPTAMDMAADKGVDKDSTTIILPLYSISDIMVRLAIGIVIDYGFVSKKAVMVFSQGSTAIVFLATPYIYGYAAMISITLLLGMNLASMNILYAVMFADYIGLNHLSLALGLCYFIIGMVALSMSPIIGYYRDGMGSYDTLFQMCGLACLLNVFLWLIVEPFFKKISDRRRPSTASSQ